LSGTGKTTLSSDTSRALIGDDEHGWCSDGVFNFEGGCYAKTIRLKKEFEPLVWSAIHRFQAILENVPLDNYRKPDFDSNIVTENTRAAYPISFISNSDRTGRGSHPSNIFLLTADAFGVLPPIARLSIHQALYYFVSGYTSKLAGTERGLGQEPQATFSSCFGSPFLPLHPGIYADLLENRLKEFKSQVWLLNTGWTGGGYGKGERIYLPYTRAMIDAVLNKKINNTRFNKQPLFRLDIPEQIPGVPQKMLDPVLTWDDKDEYQKAATKLANEFIENMKKFEEFLPVNVIEAGPLFAK
jgi:phosphoenolpyruvate carboxykinase (ATP)